MAFASGDVTFLFTDIEGSTRLWEQDTSRMSAALQRHDLIVRSAVEENHGRVVKMVGDGAYAAFADPADAVRATLHLQLQLPSLSESDGFSLRVRCGLHMGPVEERDNDFFGPPVNRAARLMSAAHGGQVLLSQVVVDRVRGLMPHGTSLRDLGIVRLRDLVGPERVYQLDHAQLRQEFPALRSLDSTPNNLPQQTTAFVGRERELGETRRLLEGARLLSLVGMGGIGKTRLATHMAADLMEQYPDGVWLVELAAISAPELVSKELAHILSIQEEAGTSTLQALSDHLKSRTALLVIDNCEHLLDASATLVGTILRAAPNIKVIATSREPLHLEGEQQYLLAPLSLPHPDDGDAAFQRSDAMQLFVERARLRVPGMALSSTERSAVAQICNLLDGIPLALELAAARLEALSIEIVAGRLDDRFRFLTQGNRMALPRHQTLRAMVDWSYDLLSQSEQLLLQCLAAFAGGWTLEAAERVCASQSTKDSEIVDGLAHLVEKSLVGFDRTTNRYSMLETIRQYAQERSRGGNEELSIRRSHLDFFVGVAEDAERVLVTGGANDAEWLTKLAEDHDNFRVALAFSLDDTKDRATAARLSGALYRFWMLRGQLSEGRLWCERSSAHIDATSSSYQAKALLGAGALAYRLGDLLPAQVHYERALLCVDLTEDLGLKARILINLGLVVSDAGDIDRGRRLLRQGADEAAANGSQGIEARALANLGRLATHQGDYADAKEPLERALKISRELGIEDVEMGVLTFLYVAAENSGDDALALELAGQALAIANNLGSQEHVAQANRNFGAIAVRRSDGPAACKFFIEALKNSERLNSRFSIAECFQEMTLFAVKVQDFHQAATFWGAAEAIRQAIATPLFPSDRERYQAGVDVCREHLGPDLFGVTCAAAAATDVSANISAGLGWLDRILEMDREAF